ncbi:MAG: CHASE2 domain-containing protein [Candidatus Poribacteria bacterium]|nr:CHASE2 domain-containing protein [Candidatus Poribacteria bacterium]
MKLSQIQRTHLLICLVGLLPFAVVGRFWTLGWFEFMELKTLDWRLHLRSTQPTEVSPDISLITIDAKSEAELGILFPRHPNLYSPLLSSLQKANPKAIGLIMWFGHEWADSKLLPGDKLFVIRPYVSPADAENRLAIPIVKDDDWTPVPENLKNARKSFSYFPFNRSDGIRRSAQLVVKNEEDAYHYSLETELFCKTYGIPLDSIRLRNRFWRGGFLELPSADGRVTRIPLDPQGRFFVRFVGGLSPVRGGAPSWRSVSFIDALNQFENSRAEFDQNFKDKCVLVGVTTDAAPEIQTSFGKQSALALRAELLNALFNRDFIWRSTPGVAFIYFICLALLSTFAALVIHQTGHGSRAMILAGSALLILHLVLVLCGFVLFNYWMEVTAFSLAIISAGIVNSLFLAHLRLRYAVTQLRETQDQLVQSEKEAVFGVMSAQVRHELRNSLSLIRAPAEMIRNNFQRDDVMDLRTRPDQIIDEMNTIIDTASTLDDMIENELSFFQDSHLNLESHDLKTILLSARDMNQALIDENRVRVNLKLPTIMPSVRLDADKIRIACANLIKNACQAMPEGGGLEIVVKLGTEFNQPGGRQRRLYISFEDEGTGIPESELQRIFEPFHTTKPRGLGLGLVNVKNIVEGHGGRVYAKSSVGIGTMFCIELPLR